LGVENRLALESQEIDLGLEPLTHLLLLGVSKESRFEILDDLRVLIGNVRRLARVLLDVEEFGLARERGHPDELPLSLADCSAEGLDVDQDVIVRRRSALGDS